MHLMEISTSMFSPVMQWEPLKDPFGVQTNSKEPNIGEALPMGASDQDGNQFSFIAVPFPPNVPSGVSSGGVLDAEPLEHGIGPGAPTQTCTGESEVGCVSSLKESRTSRGKGEMPRPKRRARRDGNPALAPASRQERRGSVGHCVASADPSGNAQGSARPLSEGPGSTPARGSEQKTFRFPPSHESPARGRCASERRVTRAMSAANKTLRASVSTPQKPESKAKVQPAGLRVPRAAKVKTSDKENAKNKGVTETLKGSAGTALKGTKELAGPRTSSGSVRELALPVARLRLDFSGKAGRSTGLKAVPATTASSGLSRASENATPPAVSGGPPVLGGTPSSRAGGFRKRAATLPGKGITGYKATALPSVILARPAASPLQRTSSTSPTAALPVDRAKKRSGLPRSQPALGKVQPGPPHRDGRGPRTRSQDVQQMRSLLTAGDRRFEAVAVVTQHILAERDEARKRCKELCQELVILREELVASAASCDKVEKEKDELRVAFEGVLRKAQGRHLDELAELEEQLGAFYSAEWEKVHQAYQQEADRCRLRMQQQVNDIRSKHEVLEKELRSSHTEKMESLKRHYETSFEELRGSHEQERQTLDQSRKQMEATLCERLQVLMRENTALNEKLKTEEENRRLLAEKSQDPHTLYLQQELESLKVVLDLKNTELHQQNKKLMELKTLRETNMNLEGCLKKTQQENEDLKARLDEHTALHKQLSTEQMTLQQTILKESKMNNRLSLQNEELLWKLHNGDLWPPRNMPPSPSFQSSSSSFSSTPLSSS